VGDTIGDLLVSLGFVTEAQLSEASGQFSGKRLGEALLALGYIDQHQLDRALAMAQEKEQSELAIGTGPIRAPRLGEVLVALDHVSPEQVVEGLRAQSQAATKNARVLVVDDSSIARRLIIRGLVGLGYDVVAYEDPTRVLEDLTHIAPDIVVTDYDMPDLDGAELCRRIKAETSTKTVPVVILTGNKANEATMSAGADGYVRKGSMEELAARIDSILREKSAASRIRKLFTRQTSDGVVEQVLQTGDLVLSGERRDVSVLFADIRELTLFAETHEPERVMATLNTVLGQLGDCVTKWGGRIGTFRGDGMMVIFGAPLRIEDHAGRAVAAARDMLATMRMHATTGAPAMKIGIGISSGAVIAGLLGSERRSEYTCVGDTVEVASRLCAHAAPDQILVSSSTVERHRDRSSFAAMRPVTLEGKAEPVALYRAISDE
jgi:adenylate cyclase